MLVTKNGTKSSPFITNSSNLSHWKNSVKEVPKYVTNDGPKLSKRIFVDISANSVNLFSSRNKTLSRKQPGSCTLTKYWSAPKKFQKNNGSEKVDLD